MTRRVRRRAEDSGSVGGDRCACRPTPHCTLWLICYSPQRYHSTSSSARAPATTRRRNRCRFGGTHDNMLGTCTCFFCFLLCRVPYPPRVGVSARCAQGVYFMGALSDYGEMVGRHFALTFEIVDASAEQRTRGRKKSEGQEDINKPYQVCQKGSII